MSIEKLDAKSNGTNEQKDYYKREYCKKGTSESKVRKYRKVMSCDAVQNFETSSK